MTANQPGLDRQPEVLAAMAGLVGRYGRAPRWVSSAPGRVNLIGEHTDYNGGFVLPMALDYRTAIAAAPNLSSRIVIYSQAVGEEVVIELPRGLAPEPRKDWSNYVRGVLSGYLRRGILVQGFHAYIHSTVPVGGGLSSSAALETATAALIEAMAGKRLDPLETIALCQTAEHIFAGVPCGIMDQYICRLARAGQALLLDCRSQAPTWIPFDDRSVTALIINTQVKHDLAAGEYARRRLACEEAARVMEQSTLREANPELLSRYEGRMSEQAMRCARHVVGEIARTRQAATSLRDRDWATFGRLLNESHESLKTDFKVSCAELDVVVEAAQALGAEGGVYGARMTGGGFGGCAIALVESSKREEIQAKIGTPYRRKTGIRATFFASRAAAGVSVLEV